MKIIAKTMLLALVGFSLSFSHVFAVSNVYLDPGSGVYGEGNTFSTKVRIDPIDACINAVDIILNYPANSIKAIDVTRGESILTLWTVEPTIDEANGTVQFSGGLPGGYCGRVDGDPGFTNVLAEIIFQVPGFSVGPPPEQFGEIIFSSSSQVLLNDGLGTPAEVIFQNSSFERVPPGQGSGSQDWFQILASDTTQPEPFSVELVRDPTVFDGQWYLVWNTLDKQSGIDHYEVYETDLDNRGFVVGKKDKPAQWVRGSSPYVLLDQSLNSLVTVKAIDKAGNERVSTKIPEDSIRTKTAKPINKSFFYIGIGMFVLLFILMVFLMLRKKKKKLSDTIKHELQLEADQPLVEEQEYQGNDATTDTEEELR